MTGAGFEAVQFVEPAFGPGEKFPGTIETHLGYYSTEAEATEVARRAWSEHLESASKDVAWWVVRVPGESLARWIADGRSPVERVLDLRSNQLVEATGD